jgi:AbrB family looped-hinge helix DNA binding protein
MRTTIDAAGRIVIPKKIREAAGLRPGSEVEVTLCDDTIRVEIPAVSFHLERRGHLLVAVPDGDAPPLTVDDVERVRREILDERFRKATGGLDPHDEPD